MIKSRSSPGANFLMRQSAIPASRLLRRLCRVGFLLAAGISALAQPADETAFAKKPDTFRALSWNVSGENFFKNAAELRAFFRLWQADILLLDEIPPGHKPAEVASILSAGKENEAAMWNVVIGLPYSCPELADISELKGGSPWGAATIAGADGSRQPSAKELAQARFQGKHVAGIASRLKQ